MQHPASGHVGAKSPVTFREMCTTTGAASPSPNGRDPRNDKKLRQRLIEAMINVGGSLGGDALEHVTGGRPLSADRMGSGAVIAASLGFALPPGVRGLVKGSLVNGLGSVAETGLRQLSGVDPHDPVAILASFAFTTGATAGLHGMGRFFRRPPAVSPLGVPTAASRPKPRVGTLELPFDVVPPRRPNNFNLADIPSHVVHTALQTLERQAPSWSPRHLRLADGLFERMFKALYGLGTDGYSDAELLRITRWSNSVQPATFPPSATDFDRYRPRADDSVKLSNSTEFNPHDHHLFIGRGFGISPAASSRLLPGRGGEAGLYAYLTDGRLDVYVDDTLDSLRNQVLHRSEVAFQVLHLSEVAFVKRRAGIAESRQLILTIRENLIKEGFLPLLDRINPPRIYFDSLQLSAAELEMVTRLAGTGELDILPDDISLSPALSQAIQKHLNGSGFLADRRYADRYRDMLSKPELKIQDLKTIFNHLAWRAWQDMGPLPLESVVAELQMAQAYAAYRAELARQAGDRFDPNVPVSMVDLYRYYAKAYDERLLISVEEVKALLDKRSIPYYSATSPKNRR